MSFEIAQKLALVTIKTVMLKMDVKRVPKTQMT